MGLSLDERMIPTLVVELSTGQYIVLAHESDTDRFYAFYSGRRVRIMTLGDDPQLFKSGVVYGGTLQDWYYVCILMITGIQRLCVFNPYSQTIDGMSVVSCWAGADARDAFDFEFDLRSGVVTMMSRMN